MGADNIPIRLLTMAADIIADPLTNFINATMLEESIFPDAEKRISVTPVFKKDDKLLKTNYRPISIPNVFSKVFERFLLNQMLPFIENVMSSLLSAYRSKYSTQHVLLRLTEQWRTCLDNDRLVGPVLMDLSKAFDCLPHDLLIAKLGAYGPDQNSLILLMSYLKDRRQSVKIKGVWKLIKSGVTQGSILGPIFFNIFINDLFYILQSDLYNFADDNTIATIADTLSELISSLTFKSGLAIDWFEHNSMIVNPDKFKAIILSKSKHDTSGISLTLGNQNITTQKSVTLPGVTIDCELSFDKHVSGLCKTASSRLNALKRLRPIISSGKTRKILVHAFVLAHFNNCPLVWYYNTAKQLDKMEKMQERALRCVTDDYNSSYQTLLNTTEMANMRVREMQNLYIEIYKILANMNPPYMQELFERSSSSCSTRRPYDLMVPRVNQSSFGSRSIKFEGARLWNHLPQNIKSVENLSTFKQLIKNWMGPSCGCSYCLFVERTKQ